MTLFIAILILVHMNAPWYMYVIAVGIWLGHLKYREE